MPLTIETQGDSIIVGLRFTRDQLRGLTKAQAVALVRRGVLDELGWTRLVKLVPLIGAARRAKPAHMGQFIEAVLTRDKPAAQTALAAMVSDGLLIAADVAAILEAFRT